MTKEALKHVTRDDTEHGKDYYLASDVDALLAQPEERNFCPRCGKRTADIHTCTPPRYFSWGLMGGDEFVSKDSLKRNIV